MYHRNLRVQLQERRNRLFRCGSRTYGAELAYLLQFLQDNRYIGALLTRINLNPSVNFEAWADTALQNRKLEFPETEEGRAKVCYGILKQIDGAEGRGTFLSWALLFSPGHDVDGMLRDLTESVVDPLMNFLHDRIDEEGNVLYLIERFKLSAEWFRREELYDLYTGATRVGEAKLDLELRAGLFEGGVDYPFSQPLSPSGQADVVALLDSDDPLVLEVKVFDPDRNRGVNNLRQGFHQITRYAQDYNQGIGYLVIFNCSDRQMVIEHEDDSGPEFPTRIPFGGKTFFVIPIDIHRDIDSASRENPAGRIRVSSQDLIGQ